MTGRWTDPPDTSSTMQMKIYIKFYLMVKLILNYVCILNYIQAATAQTKCLRRGDGKRLR